MITLYSDSVKGQWSYVALGFQQLLMLVVMMMMMMVMMITLYPYSVKGQWSHVALAYHLLWASCAHVGGNGADDDDDDSNDDDDNAATRLCEGPVELCCTGLPSTVRHLHSCW